MCNENATIYYLEPDWASILLEKMKKLKILEIQIISLKIISQVPLKTSKKK
jgi:hypothetical protein